MFTLSKCLKQVSEQQKDRFCTIYFIFNFQRMRRKGEMNSIEKTQKPANIADTENKDILNKPSENTK